MIEVLESSSRMRIPEGAAAQRAARPFTAFSSFGALLPVERSGPIGANCFP